MKKIVRIASLLMLVVITLTMTSCEKVLHANMLEKTTWTQVRPTEYVGEDGFRHSGMKTFTLRFTSTTKGKLTTKFAKEGGESEETNAAFKYDGTSAEPSLSAKASMPENTMSPTAVAMTNSYCMATTMASKGLFPETNRTLCNPQ